MVIIFWYEVNKNVTKFNIFEHREMDLDSQKEIKFSLTDWLPVTRKEVESRGWDSLDVIIVTGDAYIDHPSFGSTIIGRLIESRGYRVALLPQPNWQDDLRDFKKLGRPNLFFSVTSGSMDSMVKHYTAGKRLRSDDAYSPGGQTGLRPDYAAAVYSKILKEIYPDVPVVLGGLEASLRRSTHYDYWSDSLKASVLYESGADMLIYGMGEQPVLEILKLLEKGVPFNSLDTVPQTAIVRPSEHIPKNKKWKDVYLNSHEDCLRNKDRFSENFLKLENAANSWEDLRLIEPIDDSVIIINPKFRPETEKLLDEVYSLPYTRLPHPKYKKKKPIPAYEMIRHSLTIHRGCFGGCAFCAISAHQGKRISSRSEESILHELKLVSQMEDFRGYISDLGGPSANMYRMGGADEDICRKCRRPSCIFPEICGNLNYDHRALTALYKKSDVVAGIKKCIISSGIRYDMLVGRSKEDDKKFGLSDYMERVIIRHVSGRLKVAPEHSADNVLKIMRKPSFGLFIKFMEAFNRISKKAGLSQQVVPYMISSHPGSTSADMAELACEIKELGIIPEQVQDFTPTPMTLSSVIYYTGKNPYTHERVYVAKRKSERDEQRIFFFWYKREYRDRIKSALKKIGRHDIIKKLFS